MTEGLVIGSRGSRLALIQAEWVAGKLRGIHPDMEIRIEVIKTAGDRMTSAPFARVGSMGIFVKEIEQALSDGRIDLAVHSLKDLQTQLPSDLKLGAVTEREGARDALISRDGTKFDELRPGAVVGTSSARRRGLLAAEGRELDVRECRGNIQRRIEKLLDGDYDAILLAEAGLIRMGMEDVITEYLDVHRFVPAVGQGALGIEIRSNDKRVEEGIKGLNHMPTFVACTEERAFLREIGGGCHAPVGAHMYYRDDEAVLIAFVGTIDASWFARRELRVPSDAASGLGLHMAQEIKGLEGAGAFFREVSRDA
jgi:hydroxymethylbilane synthase